MDDLIALVAKDLSPDFFFKVSTVKNTFVLCASIHCPSLSATVCSTRYTAVRIKNCLKSSSVIKLATMKNMDNFRYTKEAITCNY